MSGARSHPQQLAASSDLLGSSLNCNPRPSLIFVEGTENHQGVGLGEVCVLWWWGWSCAQRNVVELGARSGECMDRERGMTHFSSWGLTNTSPSCTSLKATDSRRFFQKVLPRAFINQPLG